MNNVSLFKIAMNSHHMAHACNFKEEKTYTHWQTKGIVLFAIATLLTGGIAGVVLLTTAALKNKKIHQTEQLSPTTQKVEGLGNDIILPIPPNNQENQISLTALLNEFDSVFSPDLPTTIIDHIQKQTAIDSIEKAVLLIDVVSKTPQLKEDFILTKSSGKSDQLSFKAELENALKEADNEKIKVNGDHISLSWVVLIKGKNNFFGYVHGSRSKLDMPGAPKPSFSQGTGGHEVTEGPKRIFGEMITENHDRQKILKYFKLND